MNILFAILKILISIIFWGGISFIFACVVSSYFDHIKYLSKYFDMSFL